MIPVAVGKVFTVLVTIAAVGTDCLVRGKEPPGALVSLGKSNLEFGVIVTATRGRR